MNTYYKFKANIIDSLLILLGCIIASLGVNVFLSHAKLLSGGVTGIGLLLEYTVNIPVGVVVFLLNIPLLLIGAKKLNKSFIIYTTLGMLSLSFSLIITKPLANWVSLDNLDLLLYCIYGGVLCGIG